jgi:polyketide cyclase/dehydrase/lipid transport protein
MPHVELDVETGVAPEDVTAALLDFSPGRPEIWPGLTASLYEVYSVGETSAEIREGTKAPGMTFWAREHYDWSAPGLVTWTVQESNFCTPGSFVSAAISPRDDGGSRIHVTWDRTPTTFGGRIAATMIKATKGAPLRKSFEAAMTRLGDGKSRQRSA